MNNRLLMLPYELLMLILHLAKGREKWLFYQSIKDEVEWDSSLKDQFKTILVWVKDEHDFIQDPRDCIFWTWDTPEFDHEDDHVFDHDVIKKDCSLGISIEKNPYSLSLTSWTNEWTTYTVLGHDEMIKEKTRVVTPMYSKPYTVEFYSFEEVICTFRFCNHPDEI